MRNLTDGYAFIRLVGVFNVQFEFEMHSQLPQCPSAETYENGFSRLVTLLNQSGLEINPPVAYSW